MPVQGINPSYFAGMPTTRLDPNAGRVSEGFAAMPGQALSEANAMAQRRTENADNNAFKSKELALRTEQEQSSASRDDRRLAMYQQGEDRRQGQQGFENDRLKAADTRKLVQALQSAVDEGETGIAEALAAELKGRGWGVKPLGGGAPVGQPAASQASAQQPSLVPGRALRPSVAQSNAMLSPGDPLNKIVQ